MIGAGGSAAPIEITMCDDTAEISGTVEGIAPPSPGLASAGPGAGRSRAHIYCVPLPDSSGQLAQSWTHPDGTFDAQGLAPGTYRVLAFDGNATDVEYRNAAAMQVYDSKGSVVRVAAGQKEQVQLQIISTNPAANE